MLALSTQIDFHDTKQLWRQSDSSRLMTPARAATKLQQCPASREVPQGVRHPPRERAFCAEGRSMRKSSEATPAVAAGTRDGCVAPGLERDPGHPQARARNAGGPDCSGLEYRSPAIGTAPNEFAGSVLVTGSEASPPKRWSPREREVLKLIAVGKSTKEIAACLDIGAATVETHRRQLMDNSGFVRSPS